MWGCIFILFEISRAVSFEWFEPHALSLFWNLKVLLYVGMYLYIIWNESCCQFWMIWTKRSVSWMYVCMGRGSRPRRRFRVPLWLITLGAFESCKQFSSLVRNFWVLYNDVIVDVRTCVYFTYQSFLSRKFGQFLSSTTGCQRSVTSASQEKRPGASIMCPNSSASVCRSGGPFLCLSFSFLVTLFFTYWCTCCCRLSHSSVLSRHL